MTEAYLIENGEITEPLREGNLIGNGPKVLHDIDMLGNDFAMGNPGTCGKDGQGVPVGDGQPTLRVKSLTIGGTAHDACVESELQAIADRVVAQAGAGEQIEAFVVPRRRDRGPRLRGRGRALLSAQSEGIGIRVIRDGRTGFAYAGTLDAVGDRRGARRGARQRRSSAPSTSGPGWPSPTASPVTEQPLWNDELAAYPTDRKIDLAKELEKLTSAADHRVRVDDSNYADAYGESAVATTTGIRMSGRENGCYVSVSTLADDGEATTPRRRPGSASPSGRSPDEFDLERAAREAADRATRLLGATKPPSTPRDRRARSVRDRPVPRRHLVDAQRRGRRQGPLAVPRPPRRAGRRRRS